METFKGDDEVSRVKCPGQHVFHTECLQGWVRAGQEGSLKCPNCKNDIEPEGGDKD